MRLPGSIRVSSFFPRNGGTDYRSAWAGLNKDKAGTGGKLPIYHVCVESWNEYDKGTGIYAANKIRQEPQFRILLYFSYHDKL